MKRSPHVIAVLWLSIVMSVPLAGCGSQVIEDQAQVEAPVARPVTESRRPDVILGVGLDDNHFYMPLTLVRDESITITIHLERTARAGNLISCKLTTGEATIASDMGNSCSLSVSGTGLRYYVLHICNVDEDQSHQVFIDANRGRSRT
jgi:hypothetical protein